MARTFDSLQLIDSLSAEVTTIVQRITELSTLSNTQLNKQPVPGKWSVAQIVEHLNTYDRYYIPYASQSLNKAARANGTIPFKPGWLGEYFVNSMYSQVKTTGAVTNNMSAMKGHIPAETLDAAKVLNEFLADQRKLLELLEQMKRVDMASVRIPITISKFITIKLGDALRFLVAHEVRHFAQIERTLEAIGS